MRKTSRVNHFWCSVSWHGVHSACCSRHHCASTAFRTSHHSRGPILGPPPLLWPPALLTSPRSICEPALPRHLLHSGSSESWLVSLSKFPRFRVLCQHPVFFLDCLHAYSVCVSVHLCMGTVACFYVCMVWCEQWCTDAHQVPPPSPSGSIPRSGIEGHIVILLLISWRIPEPLHILHSERQRTHPRVCQAGWDALTNFRNSFLPSVCAFCIG